MEVGFGELSSKIKTLSLKDENPLTSLHCKDCSGCETPFSCCAVHPACTSEAHITPAVKHPSYYFFA